MGPAVFFMLEEADTGTTFLALGLVSIGIVVGVSAGLVVVVVVTVGAVAGIIAGIATGVGLGDELCNLVQKLDKFICHSWRRLWGSGRNLTAGVQGDGRSNGWNLVRGQGCHKGSEIVVVRVEFISELDLKIFFEGGRIEGDGVGQTNLREVW